MTPTREDLLAVVRNYWTSSDASLINPEITPEKRRLQTLWARQLEDMGPWRTFLAELRRELPFFIVGDTLTTADAGLRCIVYPPKEARTPSANWVVVGCVSLLAPVYMVHGVECDFLQGALRHHRARFEEPPPSMALPAKVVAQTIETMFGFGAVTREVAATPVPFFVELKEPPATTLFHSLFTSEPGIIP